MILIGELAAVQLGFPVWIRAAHILNILFLTLLARSGLEILSSHPRFYWNDACRPGSEWLKFTRKSPARGQVWTGRDDEVSFSSWIALPGHQSLGLGRHWHFFSVAAWILTGLVYVVLLFTLDEWRRLIPTTWAVFPDAWQALRTYRSFTCRRQQPVQRAAAVDLLGGDLPAGAALDCDRSCHVAGRCRSFSLVHAHLGRPAGCAESALSQPAGVYRLHYRPHDDGARMWGTP